MKNISNNSKKFLIKTTKNNNMNERKEISKLDITKFEKMKLPPLSYDKRSTIINNISNNYNSSVKNNNFKNKKNEKINMKIRTKTLNKNGLWIENNNKYKSKSNKKEIKKILKDNIYNLDEETRYEDEEKKLENIEENCDYEDSNIMNKIIINKDIIIETENKNFSVFHFFKTNNLFIFIKNSKFDELIQQNPNLKKNNNYEIMEDCSLPPAYKPRMNKYLGIPQCIIDTCIKGNINLIKNEDNCNIIWKLLSPGKMRDLIRKLGKNQKFNHFPSTYQIGLKDNMYKHFKLYKKAFPKLYNFVPDTYILPNDAEIFENIYKKNKKSLWIVKPVNMSRGRGIHLLKDGVELKELIKKSYDENNIPDLISKYLDKPHLINNKKYDLRIYVLVSSFTPLKFYIYYNGLVRFATEDYNKGNYDNIYIHITNYSINKNNLKYKANQKNNKEIEELGDKENEEDDSSKWSLVEYRNYFKKIGKSDIMENIWKQIEDIIIKSLLTIVDDNCKEISVNKNNSLFELYGYDILIDESYKAWLLEVNVNPSLHCTSPLDLSIKTDLVTDIFNIIGILPYNHNYGEPVYNYEMMKNKIEEKEKGIIIKKEKNKKIKLPKLYNGNGNNNKIVDKSLMNLRMAVVQNFNIDNLRKKIPEYDNEYYKKVIEVYKEEKCRASTTGFTMIFPKKDNVNFYCKILAKDNSKINDTNIVLWEYILNNE